MELGNIMFGNSRGEFSVNRDWQGEFVDFLHDCKIDSYGNYEGSNKDCLTKRGGFENEVFTVNPYYWGDDEKIAEEPNFIYKPENITIDWYKYALRDSYCNIELTYEKLKEIMDKCLGTVKKS